MSSPPWDPEVLARLGLLHLRARQATAGLNGVQVLADGRAVVVGERGIAGLYDPATDSLEESPAPTSDVLHAAWQHGDQVYAVGGNLYTADDFFHGSVFRAPLPD